MLSVVLNQFGATNIYCSIIYFFSQSHCFLSLSFLFLKVNFILPLGIILLWDLIREFMDDFQLSLSKT